MRSEPRPNSTEDRLADWFVRGVEPDDVPALHALIQARPAIQSLSTLFSGTEAAVLVRLLVLRELGRRGGDRIAWVQMFRR